MVSFEPSSPRSTLTRVALSFVVTFAALEGLLLALGERSPLTPFNEVLLLHVALAFVGIDLAVGAVLVGAVVARLRAETDGPETRPAPPVSVLLPVWNEGLAVRSTLEAWAAQREVPFELLVGDDGSTDGTSEQLVAALGLTAQGPHHWAGVVHGTVVQLYRFPHAGKGATLNALARKATHGVLVTVDADTRPTPGSLRRLACAFLDERVDLATGVVTIANGRDGWLLGNQSAEYLKNAFARIAWSSLDGLEQVPGAFAGVRTPVFHAVGGFPEDSLTEDYELTFRVAAYGVERGRPPRVVTVLRAQVFTDGPSTVKGFIAQRTRWFAGFLSTLFRFRHLVGRADAGAYGLVRFPLKVLDAVLPLLAFASLVILVRGGVETALGVSRLSIALFVVRWVWDAVVYGLALAASRRLGAPAETARASPALALGWVLTSLEALTYVWFKHAAALRGVWWAVARVRTWEASREVVSRPS